MSSYKRIPKSLVKKSAEIVTITEDYTGDATGYYQYYEENELQKVKEKVGVTEQEMMEELALKRQELIEKAYQEGFERAKREVEQEVRLQNESLLNEAQALYEKANQYHQNILAESAQMKEKYIQEEYEQLLQLIFACSEKIVRQELEKHPEKLGVLFEKILTEITYENKKVFLRVHPKTREMLKTHTNFAEQNYLELLPDGTLSEGDLVIETEREFLDATIESQIDAIKHVVRGALNESFKSY